jgi:hypothetical protein
MFSNNHSSKEAMFKQKTDAFSAYSHELTSKDSKKNLGFEQDKQKSINTPD